MRAEDLAQAKQYWKFRNDMKLLDDLELSNLDQMLEGDHAMAREAGVEFVSAVHVEHFRREAHFDG